MNPEELFEVAGGTVAGHHHALAGRNNQDAYAWAFGAGTLAAVVCDGCGSSPHSEVGAQLGARLVTAAILETMEGRSDLSNPELWEKLRLGLLARLRGVAESLGGRVEAAISEYLLFTVVGAVVGVEEACLFSLGDGLAIVNGERFSLGPFANNAPSYLAYGLVDRKEESRIVLHRSLPAEEVESVLLGTDGTVDFEGAAERNLPGRDEPLGALEQFWRDGRYFENGDAIRRRLTLAARPGRSPGEGGLRSAGLLPDDTTLVVVRRRGGDRS